MPRTATKSNAKRRLALGQPCGAGRLFYPSGGCCLCQPG
jgi:hypothetical protein